MAEQVGRQIHACKVAIILGIKTYGEPKPGTFSTYEELQLIVEQKKATVFVTMCDEFSERLTSYHSYRFSRARLNTNWFPSGANDAPPTELIEKILAELRRELVGITPHLPGLKLLCQGLELPGELQRARQCTKYE